jgi:hypothetical protein
MYREHTSPARAFWHGCLLILGGCLALWVTVRILTEIWPWLVVAAALTAIIVTIILILRWRRQRW